uniref:Uncharacterized protein n=1 Tax=Octopus bimaculoides TaxID=37653 RepID=A0A0L8GG10_OCTBM
MNGVVPTQQTKDVSQYTGRVYLWNSGMIF